MNTHVKSIAPTYLLLVIPGGCSARFHYWVSKRSCFNDFDSGDVLLPIIIFFFCGAGLCLHCC